MEDQHEEQVVAETMDYILKRSLLAKSKLAIILNGPEGTVYCCVECPAKYTDKEKMELHLCMHNKEYRFLCGICGTGLKRKEHLDRHMRGHEELRPHICPVCGKGFKRKEHLNIHRTIHTGDKTQVCSLCQRSFYRKDHLQKHLQTHNKLFIEQNVYPQEKIKQEESYAHEGDSEDMILVPDIKIEVNDSVPEVKIEADDSQEYEMQEDYNELVTETNSSIPEVSIDSSRPYICFVCNKTYKRKDHLKLHSLTHMKKEKICSECGKAFHREDQLLVHMNTHLKAYQHNADDSTQMYHDDMDEIITDESSLLIPMPVKRNEHRPHECPICHRKFKRKQHLKVHSNVHRKEVATIWCSLCHEGFQNNDQFENHHCMSNQDSMVDNGEESQAQSTPQEAKKENKYPVEFVNIIDNSMHNDMQEEQSLLMAREEKLIPTPQRVYVCRFCSKPFKRKDHFKIHLHIHTGIKSFFCPDCGKGFYRKDHLQKHSQVHNKVKPAAKSKAKKELPALYPIHAVPKKKEIRPEITIHAPSNTKLRVPLQIKVPYQMVMSMDNGEQKAVTIDPQGDELSS